MFEPPLEKKEISTNWLATSVVLVIVLGVVGILYYTLSKRSAPAPAPVAAAAKGPADPVHDLKIIRATMDKDRTGTTAVWLVTIENRSAVYAYSQIRYETAYIGADNTPILANQGTISASIGPGEQKSSELRDALYPTGTAWYKFRITGATAVAR